MPLTPFHFPKITFNFKLTRIPAHYKNHKTQAKGRE